MLCMSCSIGRGGALSLPPAVQMGGAIVAAVEADVEKALATTQQRHQRELITQAEQQLQKLLNNELSAEQVAQLLDNWMAEGEPRAQYVIIYCNNHVLCLPLARGKHHKHKKLLKMVYPLLGAAAVAKLILLPLILKWLTALSASSFVMGKIALLTAGLLAFKSIMSSGHARDRLEIIHSSAPTYKSYHQPDLSSSGSSWMPIRQHYIPLGVSKDAAYRLTPGGLDSKELYKPFL